MLFMLKKRETGWCGIFPPPKASYRKEVRKDGMSTNSKSFDVVSSFECTSDRLFRSALALRCYS
jgi:hypothetical protein